MNNIFNISITKGISPALLDIKDVCAGRDAHDVASWIARQISQRIGKFTQEKTIFVIELHDYITNEFMQWSSWTIWPNGVEFIGSQGKG